MTETLKRIWDFSEGQHGKIRSALILSLVRSTLGVTQICAVIFAVNVFTGDMDPKRGIMYTVIMTAVCVTGNFIVSYFQQIRAIESGMYLTAGQRVSIAEKMRHMPLGFFTGTTTERIASTLTGTMQGVETGATMSIITIVSGLFNSAVLFIFLLFYELPAGLITGAGIVIYLLVVSLQFRVSRRDAPARQEAQTSLSEASIRFVRGIGVTKSFSFAGGDANMEEAIDDSCRKNIGLTDRSMPSQYMAHIAVAVFEILLLAGAFFLTTGGDPGKTMVLVIVAFAAFSSLGQAGSTLSMLGMIESGLAEVAEIKDGPVLDEKEDGKTPDGDDVRFDHVSFSYGDREILHDVSAVMEKGKMTAVIGPSGAGKTTMCRLIARFQDVDGGSITVGGTDVRDIPFDDLMKKISMVFQNVYLFEDTILNNIRFGRPDATLEEVREAARKARCDDFIMALPDGYDTVVRERGSSLSGGERQRISIARAMIKDSPVIILDEATSALDVENEKEFFEAVDELVRDRTVIMIAHRLTTLRHAHRIIALKDGKIVQDGRPADLAEADGVYRDFLHAREAAAGWKLGNAEK